jgi:hypothetical protein
MEPTIRRESTPQSLAGRIARIISEVMSPIVLAPLLFLAVSLYSMPQQLWLALFAWFIIVVGMSLAPILFILRGVRKGKYTDHHVSVRSQRLGPLLFALCCVAVVLLLLLFLRVASALIATTVSVLVTFLLASVITLQKAGEKAPVFQAGEESPFLVWGWGL